VFDSTQETWRAVVVITLTLAAVSVAFLASIVLSRRRFVTIRREKLEALRESELRFRSLIERSFDVIMMLDSSGKIIYASPSTARVIGYVPEELVEHVLKEFAHPDVLLHIMRPPDHGIAEYRDAVPFEGQIYHKDGSWRCIEGLARNMLKDPSVSAIVVNYRDITERKNADENLQKSRNELRSLSGHLQSVREEERISIAREVHDELGQLLTVLKMDLALLERDMNSGVQLPEELSSTEQIESMITVVDGIIHSVRRIATELRPQVLDELGLNDAIEGEVEGFQARTGVKCQLHLEVDDLKLDAEQKTALYRIFQEALTNVARHPQATTLKINFEQRDGLLVLEVIDDGRGMPEDKSNGSTSLGVLGMKERALILGGELNISGGSGGGTVVSLRIPVTR